MAVILKVVEKSIDEIRIKSDMQKVHEGKIDTTNPRRGYYIDDKGRVVFSLDIMEDSRGQAMYIAEDIKTGRIISYPVRRGCFAEQERGRYQRVEYVLTKYTLPDSKYIEKDIEGKEVYIFDEETPQYTIKNHKDYKLGHNFILINRKPKPGEKSEGVLENRTKSKIINLPKGDFYE